MKYLALLFLSFTLLSCSPPAIESPSVIKTEIEVKPDSIESVVKKAETNTLIASGEKDVLGVKNKPLIGLPTTPSDIIKASPKGYQLILEGEVGGGKSYYNRFLIKPEYTGAGGVTTGVGADWGVTDPKVSRYDWQKMRQDWVERLVATYGITGNKAKAIIKNYSDILTPWDLAEQVFQTTVLSRYYNLTEKTFPGFDQLHPDAKLVMTSIVFNRGSLIDNSDRRKEMRNLRTLIKKPEKDYKAMAREIRSMKRIWIGTDIEEGMNNRREMEAKLMENIKE